MVSLNVKGNYFWGFSCTQDVFFHFWVDIKEQDFCKVDKVQEENFEHSDVRMSVRK